MVECRDLEPVLLNRKINEFSPLKLDNSVFSASHLWEIPNEELYPDDIKREINRLKNLLSDFIKSGYSPEFCAQNLRRFKAFRKLALNLAKYENIIDAIIYSKYWTDSYHWRYLGKAIARILVYSENLNNGEIPATQSRARKFEKCRKILTAVKSGALRGYATWGDFLESLYGKNWRGLATFIKKFPFKDLISRLPYLDHYKLEERVHTSSNFLKEVSKKNSVDTIKNLYHACQMGFYEKDGIYSWHELLYYCQTIPSLQDQFRFWDLDWNCKFHIQLKESSLPNSFFRRYSSRKGLEIVAQDLFHFKIYFERHPTQFDFPFVLNILDGGVWQRYGISTWEQLIKYSMKLRLQK